MFRDSPFHAFANFGSVFSVPSIASNGELRIFQRIQMLGFIIRCAIFPATEKDPNPLECQCAQGSLMRAAFSSLLLVKSACPKRFINGLRSPFNKRLPYKLWTPQP